MYYNFADLNYLNSELTGVWPGWTAVKLLGRGSFGAVYEIRRNVRGNLEKAAMKVLRVPDNDVEIARLQLQGMSPSSIGAYYENLMDGICNEIRIMQNFVGNSHIVSYEDYYIRKRSDGISWDLFIRMELLTGLPDYIRLHDFDEKMVLKLGMDVAQGLRDCHGSGIIHRDIKPDNIFVNRVGNFKLGDFGVSRNTPGTSDLLSFKGTLGYMAPEVYRMLSTDARSDIYSLGMVLYQCLNDNRLPFLTGRITPESVEAARQRRFAGEALPDPAHGSAGLRAIVRKALAADPGDRFRNAGELYFALMDVYKKDYIVSYKAEFWEEQAQGGAGGLSGGTVHLKDLQDRAKNRDAGGGSGTAGDRGAGGDSGSGGGSGVPENGDAAGHGRPPGPGGIPQVIDSGLTPYSETITDPNLEVLPVPPVIHEHIHPADIAGSGGVRAGSGDRQARTGSRSLLIILAILIGVLAASIVAAVFYLVERPSGNGNSLYGKPESAVVGSTQGGTFESATNAQTEDSSPRDPVNDSWGAYGSTGYETADEEESDGSGGSIKLPWSGNSGSGRTW